VTKEIVELDAVDWTRPKGPDKRRLDTDEEILRVIREFKISYPNEIVMHTGFSQQTVLSRLGYMKVQGILERVILGVRPPDDLKERLPFLFSQGLKGNTLRRMSWYRIVDHGSEAKE